MTHKLNTTIYNKLYTAKLYKLSIKNNFIQSSLKRFGSYIVYFPDYIFYIYISYVGVSLDQSCNNQNFNICGISCTYELLFFIISLCQYTYLLYLLIIYDYDD